MTPQELREKASEHVKKYLELPDTIEPSNTVGTNMHVLTDMVADFAQSLQENTTTNTRMLPWAFKYALGRSTYVVQDVVLEFKNCWDSIDDNDKDTIKKEIETAIRNGRAGMPMYAKLWSEILELDNTQNK